MVQYRYDAWGKLLATSTLTTAYTTLANLNPLRYRGYVYDTETGLYYLRSRYYNPEWGRFINADTLLGNIGGLLCHNIFTYCCNSPVSSVDNTGKSFWWIIPVLVCAILTGCSSSNETAYSGMANCYAYALKLKTDPRTQKPFQSKPQPGELSGNPLAFQDLQMSPQEVKSRIADRVQSDAVLFGLFFSEVHSSNHVPAEGNWLIALAFSPNNPIDYHWWRKDEDGTWSHKPGASSVMYMDYSGQTITDPYYCDRGPYVDFLGYFEIGPNGGH